MRTNCRWTSSGTRRSSWVTMVEETTSSEPATGADSRREWACESRSTAERATATWCSPVGINRWWMRNRCPSWAASIEAPR